MSPEHVKKIVKTEHAEADMYSPTNGLEKAKKLTLQLALNGEYFDAIRNGSKLEEYRLDNEYWNKRLVGKSFDGIVLTRGYPPANDASRRIELPWRGYRNIRLTHPHFGPDEVAVFAIDVSGVKP